MAKKQPIVIYDSEEFKTQSQFPLDNSDGCSQKWDDSQIEVKRGRYNVVSSFGQSMIGKHKSTQTNNENSQETPVNIPLNYKNDRINKCDASTQSNCKSENVKSANEFFGMLIARELENVPQIKRRHFMYEIIKLIKHKNG